MNAPQITPSRSGNPARKKALTILSVVVLIGLAWGGYAWLQSRHIETTDNAYVQGNVVQITPQNGGTVSAILADDTDFVKAGQTLVQLDAADARIALEQAEANLAQVVRQTSNLYAGNATLSAQIALREAEMARAQTEVGRATDDLARRQSLTGDGAVSQEELQHTQSQLAAAQSALAAAQAGAHAARQQLRANQSLTDGSSIAAHPTVVLAAARVREAYLAAKRTTVAAPMDGYVARRTVQLGQRVAAGTPLLSIIPLQQVWVDANFKEVQLRDIRIGQPVHLTADLYGKKVEYQGTVAGLGAGTGAAFALLPAQNATGNWIKVVQRIPVRVALDPRQLVQNPLRIGLSMEAAVDTSDQSGKALADGPRETTALQTEMVGVSDKQAEEAVKRVIASNLPRAQ